MRDQEVSRVLGMSPIKHFFYKKTCRLRAWQNIYKNMSNLNRLYCYNVNVNVCKLCTLGNWTY